MFISPFIEPRPYIHNISDQFVRADHNSKTPNHGDVLRDLVYRQALEIEKYSICTIQTHQKEWLPGYQ